MNDTLIGRVVETGELSHNQKNEMFHLLQNNFDGYTKENFDRDLEEKDHVILLEDSLNRIGGFTNIQNFQVSYDNKTIRGTFSGDTIVDPVYWNKHDMFKVWLKYNIKKREESEDPLYWFLICSGCRTYKIVPAFFAEFYPKFDSVGTSQQKEILDIMAKYKFGNSYNSETGIIQFSPPKERLKQDLANITDGQIRNLHVKYFLKKNPEYYLGDELACIIEISEKNLTPMGKRLLL
jgi:hypothetical protein